MRQGENVPRPAFGGSAAAGAQSQVPLGPLTTLGVGGPARRLVTAERDDEIVAVAEEGGELLVLGGGSNVLVADAGFDGTVLRVATRGIQVADGSDEVTVAAGEPWDAFVAWAVGEGRAGVECLAGIPGLVGAVPMQNVGAYGQDVSESIVRVRFWDRDARALRDFTREECRFAYRSSVFRGGDRRIVTRVTFALPRARAKESRPVRYAELARALGVAIDDAAPLEEVRATVIALRRKKGMVLDAADPDTRSAGSFFTNPILAPRELEALRARADAAGHDDLPVFPEKDGRAKVSAGWLIERAGFAKGFALGRGRAAISGKHALALTNRGGATASELVDLARAVRRGVHDRFGVTLESEPVLVGVTL